MMIATRLSVLLLLVSLCASAQTDSVYYGRDSSAKPPPSKRLRDKPWADNITFGGNFQLWFGNPSFIFLSPTVGFTPVENLNVGVGGIYNYTSVNFGAYGRFTQSIFGSHTYVRYVIAQSYFVQTQFDLLRQPDWYSPDADDKVWVQYLLAGGGFRQMIGDRAALMTSIMYNLTPHPFSIYPSRVIVQFGFVTTL